MNIKSYYQQKCKSHNTAPLPNSIWSNPIHFIACGFGIGALPIMPGTWATLFSILLYLIISPLSTFTYLLICIALTVVGAWLCGKTNRDFNEKDHVGVCFDEIATFPICLIGIPCTWYYILMAFVLFRLLDIFKPFPISFLEENLEGGWGAMLDDVAAALATLFVLHIINLF